MTIDKCRTCKHAFTTGKDRWYCKKALADKDECREYEMPIGKVVEEEKSLSGYTFKVVVAGNCVFCGKPIDDDNIFLCKDCRSKQNTESEE